MSALVYSSVDDDDPFVHDEITFKRSKPPPLEIPDDDDEGWPSDDELSPLFSPSTGSSSSKRRSEDDGFSSDSERRHKRAKTRSLSPSRFRLPRDNDTFLDFRARPRTVFVDKTRFTFQLPGHYRYLLLRPPRFGKTAFLSMLGQFYDIHGAGTFSKYFDTDQDRDSEHSQHLCLPITLADISVFSNSVDFATALKCTLLNDVRSFVVKYAQELGFSDPSGYLQYQRDASLTKVLELVRSRGKTLFVSVDSCDAPVRQAMLSHIIYPGWQHALVTHQEIAQLVDNCLWRPLKDGGDVVAKLFVTGTLSVQTPSLRDLVAPAPDYLQSCCGFTEAEAVQFTQSFLPDLALDFVELRRRHGDYSFVSYETIQENVFNPRVVIDHISGSSSRKPLFDLLAHLLKLVPIESDVPNVVTQEGLIELLATGVVEMESVELDSLDDLDGTSVFWGALYHAGALTHSSGSKSTFRIANPEALLLIHTAADNLAHDRYDPHDRWNLFRPDGFYDDEFPVDRFNFATALNLYDFHERHGPLLDLLSQALRDQTLRSLGKKHEPTLRGILELMMRNDVCMSSESLGRTEPIILLPADVTRVRIFGDSPDHVREWELTTLTLLGFWQAANPNDDEPSVEALRELHQSLCKEDEASLLDRRYSVWSESLQAMETVTVRSFFEVEAKHTRLVAVGGAHILRWAVPSERVEAHESAR